MNEHPFDLLSPSGEVAEPNPRQFMSSPPPTARITVSPSFTLRRIVSRTDGVGGVLLMSTSGGLLPVAVTLEDPDLGNAPGISCIPARTYRCVARQSPKFGRTFEVTGVPGRSLIEFHSGNSHLDTHGCILLGKCFAPGDADELWISESRVTFAAFISLLGSVSEFSLAIEDRFGPASTFH